MGTESATVPSATVPAPAPAPAPTLSNVTTSPTIVPAAARNDVHEHADGSDVLEQREDATSASEEDEREGRRGKAAKATDRRVLLETLLLHLPVLEGSWYFGRLVMRELRETARRRGASVSSTAFSKVLRNNAVKKIKKLLRDLPIIISSSGVAVESTIKAGPADDTLGAEADVGRFVRRHARWIGHASLERILSQLAPRDTLLPVIQANVQRGTLINESAVRRGAFLCALNFIALYSYTPTSAAVTKWSAPDNDSSVLPIGLASSIRGALPHVETSSCSTFGQLCDTLLQIMTAKAPPLEPLAARAPRAVAASRSALASATDDTTITRLQTQMGTLEAKFDTINDKLEALTMALLTGHGSGTRGRSYKRPRIHGGGGNSFATDHDESESDADSYSSRHSRRRRRPLEREGFEREGSAITRASTTGSNTGSRVVLLSPARYPAAGPVVPRGAAAAVGAANFVVPPDSLLSFDDSSSSRSLSGE